jgi:hypothetical protein
MMRMMNVLRVLIAEILILHGVQTVDGVEELSRRNKRRQLLEWLIVHAHHVAVECHVLAFYRGYSFWEWKMEKCVFEVKIEFWLWRMEGEGEGMLSTEN